MLPFIHAFGGCDTTSSIFEKGKGAVLKLLEKSESLQQQVEVFGMPHASEEEIGKLGVQTFILLYGGKLDDNLEDIRYRGYIKIASTSSKMCPSKLPPTQRVAHFHSLRVNYQVCLRHCYAVMTKSKSGI